MTEVFGKADLPAQPMPSSHGERAYTVAIIVLILGLSYSFNGLDRSAFPALLSPISSELGITPAQGGFLSNIFTLNIALFGALSGWFIGRFGRKHVLVGGLLAYSAFTFAIPLASSYTELAFYRAMTGAGEALHITAIFSMIGAYFGKRRGTFFGINNAFFGLGTFLAPLIASQMFQLLGSWRYPFYLFGIAGMVSAISVYLLVPSWFAAAIDQETRRDDDVGDLRCPTTLINLNSAICTVAFFLTGFSFLAYMALYSLYLKSALGYSVADAGLAFSMFGIGALTAFFGGWLGDKLKRWGLIVGLALMSLNSYVMFFHVTSLYGQMATSFIFGVLLSGFLYPRFLAVMQKSVQSHHISAATSIILPVFYFAGFLSGPAFGALVPLVGWQTAGGITVTMTAAGAAVLVCFVNPKRMRGA